MSVLTRFFPDHVKKGLGRFAGSSGSATCSDVCLPSYWMHRWERLLLGPLAYGARLHNPHKGVLVCGWIHCLETIHCSNSLFRKRDNKDECLMQP